MPELKFEDLPAIPKIWLDFVRSRLSFRPANTEMEGLIAQIDVFRKHATWREKILQAIANEIDAPLALENVQRLRKSESVVVIADINPGVLGGPFSQIWKCFTAIKICEELAKHHLSSVPVCWLRGDAAPDGSKQALTLLDSESELRIMQLQSRDSSPAFSELINQVADIGRKTFDEEILEILRTASGGETDGSSAAAEIFACLLRDWGLIVLNADSRTLAPVVTEAKEAFRAQKQKIETLLKKQAEDLGEAGYPGEASVSAVDDEFAQSLLLPVAVRVIDPDETYSYATSLPVFAQLGLPKPPAWPRASATIVDARSRRILERYGLDIRQLYRGEREVVDSLNGQASISAPQKLAALVSEAETTISELSISDSTGEEFAKSAADCKQKVIYQLDKLRGYCEAARTRREDAVRRQIHKACNFLAPRESVQERELAGILIPLRYSRAGLRDLYDKLDIFKLEHQLISMD